LSYSRIFNFWLPNRYGIIDEEIIQFDISHTFFFDGRVDNFLSKVTLESKNLFVKGNVSRNKCSCFAPYGVLILKFQMFLFQGVDFGLIKLTEFDVPTADFKFGNISFWAFFVKF